MDNNIKTTTTVWTDLTPQQRLEEASKDEQKYRVIISNPRLAVYIEAVQHLDEKNPFTLLLQAHFESDPIKKKSLYEREIQKESKLDIPRYVAIRKYIEMNITDKTHESRVQELRAELKTKAEQGNAVAQANLGVLLVNKREALGINDEKTALTQALDWYTKAAEQGHGHVGAQNNLGALLVTKWKVLELDEKAAYREARKWLTAAAEQGHVGAQYSLGWLLVNKREALELDEKAACREARKWLTEAAAQDADAQNSLGLLLVNKRQVLELDEKAAYREALDWYTKAAEQGHGHVGAQANLGWLLVTKWKVLELDEKAACREALDWCIKAAEQGDANAQHNLGLLLRMKWQVLGLDVKEALTSLTTVLAYNIPNKQGLITTVTQPYNNVNRLTTAAAVYVVKSYISSLPANDPLTTNQQIKAKTDSLDPGLEYLFSLANKTKSIQERMGIANALFNKYISLERMMGDESDLINLWSEVLYNFVTEVANAEGATPNSILIQNRCLAEVPKRSDYYFRAKNLYITNTYNLWHEEAVASEESSPVQSAYAHIKPVFKKMHKYAVEMREQVGRASQDEQHQKAEQDAIDLTVSFMNRIVDSIDKEKKSTNGSQQGEKRKREEDDGNDLGSSVPKQRKVTDFFSKK